MRRSFTFAFCLLTSAFLSCAPAQPRAVRIATTTSLEGSGLLAELSAAVRRDRGLEIQAFVVGSGQAMNIAERGEAAVIITHDPDREVAFVARHSPALYRQFMWNDFILVGPRSDPARVRGSAKAVDASRRIAIAGAPFCSRGDQSGTHSREMLFWKEAGVDPKSNPQYRSMGQPMAHLLRSADELQCYALTDRATFDRLRAQLKLDVLVEGDPELRNVYAVTLMREHPPEAEEFVGWLLSARGRSVIEGFRINGRQQFQLMPPSSTGAKRSAGPLRRTPLRPDESDRSG